MTDNPHPTTTDGSSNVPGGHDDDYDGSAVPRHTGESELSDDDLAMAQALGQGLTHLQVAEAFKCSTKTIQRRLANQAFCAEISRERTRRLEHISGQLGQLATAAIGTLEELTQDGVGSSDRLRATQIILAQLLRYSGHLGNADNRAAARPA